MYNELCCKHDKYKVRIAIEMMVCGVSFWQFVVFPSLSDDPRSSLSSIDSLLFFFIYFYFAHTPECVYTFIFTLLWFKREKRTYKEDLNLHKVSFRCSFFSLCVVDCRDRYIVNG